MTIQHRMFEDYGHLVEIEHALRLWNYLEHRQLSYEIDVVILFINEKWVIDGDSAFLMTRDEYNQILKDQNLTRISDGAELRELALDVQ